MCVNGHVMDEANTYRRGSYTRCRQCHADRARRTANLKRIEILPDRIATLQSELDRLRQAASADPTNHRLSEQRGMAERRWRYEATREQREADKVVNRAARLGAVEEYRNRLRMDDRAWVEAVQAVGFCPHCKGEGHGHFKFDQPLKATGYSTRVGERGVQCLVCNGQWTLEAK